MGKISPVSAKYIVHANIQIEGVIDKPDVIGAIFGQTEGLLGADLELRELQRSGRIGRIDVEINTRTGKSEGEIIVPSSLDKAETAIIAAAIETIQRIGPCNARVRTEKIEDVRVSKRNYVVERAKELLKVLTDSVLPDSQEITDEVAHSVRMMEIKEYGKDRLPAGPAIEESDEVIVVEGRADVLNLLKHGIKNAIGMNGTNMPPSIKDLAAKKVVTLFVDGDRGGDLIIREVTANADIDYVIKAPDGKEVEEITKKEIHKALRGRIAVEQAKMDIGGNGNGKVEEERKQREIKRVARPANSFVSKLPKDKVDNFKKMLDDLIGTRGAYVLDDGMNILGKVPVSELQDNLRSLRNVHAIVFDGVINRDLVSAAEKSGVSFLVGMSSRIRPSDTRIGILTNSDF